MTAKPFRICLKVSLFIIFLQLLQPAFAQYDFSHLDQQLQQYQKELGNNTVTLIYKDGKIIYQKEMGDFKANTVAPIASCSKWLTAALVMTFVDEGKLSLDDRIDKYLPDAAKYNKGYITIRQCLSHTTGIAADKPGLASILKMSRYETLEEEVNDFISRHDIVAKPGTEFFYSSVGLNIAGRILECISTKPFERLALDRLFRPLGMKNSTFAGLKATNPSGSAKSTATDYMNFQVMILNKGMYNGKRILSEKAIADMQEIQTKNATVKYAPKTAEGYPYACGEWVLGTDASGKSTVVSSPGLFGTWPMVDYPHGYACIFFVKTLLGSEQKKEVYQALMNAVNEQMK